MSTTPQNTDYIDIHSHNSESRPGVFRIYNLFLQDYSEGISSRIFSCGLHPWHIQHYHDIENFSQKLEKAIKNPGMIAIGEAGLDKIIPVKIEVQEEIFRKQVELSEKYSLPLIIHCVRAFQELVNIRKDSGAVQPWVLHGFNGNSQIAEELINQGIFISGGLRLIKNMERCKEVLNRIPPSMLFAETDDDEKFSIQEVYRQMSSCMQIDEETLRKQVFDNFISHFLKR